MKTAQSVGQKFVDRAGAAVEDYRKNAAETVKDPTALAAAAATRAASEIAKAFSSGRWAKNLQAAGKGKWLKGVTGKGANRFAEGVADSLSSYVTNSGKYDSARNASAGMPTGEKGSATNLAKVGKVVTTLRAQKVGSTS